MSRRPVALALTGLLALGLAGCGTGLSPQTYKKHSYDYVNVDLGQVAIRNLAVEGPAEGTGTIPAGGTAKASGTLVSQSDGDTLTGATSPAAANVTLEQDGRTVQQIDIPKLGRAGGWAIVLQGTNGPLRAGSYVDVVLTFAKAGRTTLHLPVHSSASSSGSATPTPTPS